MQFSDNTIDNLKGDPGSITGGINNGYPNWQNLKDVEDLAVKNDPNAIAILNLYKQTENDFTKLRKELNSETENFKKKLEDYEKSLKKTDSLIIGALFFIGITFLSTISLVFFDLIKEKDIYLQNNNLYQNYSDKNSELNNKISDQKIEINNLINKVQKIYDKNTFLK